jgi:SAM-dependent methyltransferase
MRPYILNASLINWTTIASPTNRQAEYANDPIRDMERCSILAFLTEHHQYFRGRVLDYGCGAQPYRKLIEHLPSTEYIPWDRHNGGWQDSQHSPYDDPFHVDTPKFSTVLCTQVLQYVPDPISLICRLGFLLHPRGHLILTYPTNWDEVPNDRYGEPRGLGGESFDMHRFTKLGMEAMIPTEHSGPFRCLSRFNILHHELRAVVQVGGFRFPLGYGLVAERTV